MTLIVEAVRKRGQLDDPLDTTESLVENHGDVPIIEVDFRYEVYRIAQSEDTKEDPENLPVIVFAPLSVHTGRAPDIRAIWISDIGTSWEDFNVGDGIFVSGALNGNNNGGALITEILLDDKGTHTLITDRTNYGLEAIPVDTGIVANITPQTSMLYSHGLIENSEIDNYVSKVDGSEQIAILDGISSTNQVFQNAILKGNRSWILSESSIQVKGNLGGLGNPTINESVPALTPSIQAFTVRHEVPIAPFVLAGQFNDFQNEIPPSWFLDDACLKYVFKIDTNTAITNPNNQASVLSESILDGNTGWRRENFNGTPTKYSIEDLVYKRADNTINTALELTINETKINFTIVNTDDAPFDNFNTKINFEFYWAPQDRALYRDIKISTSETMEHNFMFDNVISTVGGPDENPRSFGTSELKIKSITSTFVSTSRIDVAVVMQLSENLVTRISAQKKQKYVIGVGVKNHRLSRNVSDGVKLPLDATDFFLDNLDPGLVVQEQELMIHPKSNPETDTIPSLESRVEDDILGVNNWILDLNGREDDEVSVFSIDTSIIARKNTGASFVLDSFSRSLSNSQQIKDTATGLLVSDFNINQSRGFKTPADENRGNVKLFRRYSLDGGKLFYYRTQFPWINRWEYFIALTGVNLSGDASEFFDAAQPNNGINQNWIPYGEAADWELIWQTFTRVLKNGAVLSYPIETPFIAEDYFVGQQWDAEVIRGYDENDDLLENGPDGFMIKYADGRIEAEFNYIGPAPAPSLAEVGIVLILDVFEKGNFKDTYTISSFYDAHPDTWWFSVDDSNRTVVTNPSANKFIGEAKYSASKLPIELEFKCSARLYDLRPAVPVPLSSGKKKEDGTFKTLEDGTFKKLE